MREVTFYIAYDGKEFDTREDCKEYEDKALNLIRNIGGKITFYGKNNDEISLPSSSFEIEDWLERLERARNYCLYCRKKDCLTNKEAQFIWENTGVFVYNRDFSCETGLFAYDIRTMRWTKVDE
jgi:hypothetical protein